MIMEKEVKGVFCQLNGKKYYKIENYDRMENFFMTITGSSDIWNFCWSKGGITAGRTDSNHAIFPYYTADKVFDVASYTGNYTCIAAKTESGIKIWEPFKAMISVPSVQKEADKYLIRNIYKSENGNEVLFEEINTQLNLKFVTGWTSSQKFGIVRKSTVENLGNSEIEISVLDGCQNILPACVTSDFQNSKSILLDAYKKTDLDEKNNLAIFSVSSIVSDKAEPNESLYANVSWFSTDDKIILATDAPSQFLNISDFSLPSYKNFSAENVTKGERSSAFICKNFSLKENQNSFWYQIFDTSLSASKIAELNKEISNRQNALKALENDIELCDKQMTEFLASADGIQETADKISCLHHRENVMFNIMRGGLILNDGNILVEDFINFAHQRNIKIAEQLSCEIKKQNFDKLISYEDFKSFIQKQNNNQFTRIFLEYIPLTFSRRHGDPSRPWNAFSIKIKTPQGNPILNYEGNWRDIFQNWEALVFSYPQYIKNMCAKFLNAMTIDGFNPYKINRAGIDWEIPDPTNPWAFIGYWGDHQVIYFDKLLEFYDKTNREELLNSLDEKIYTSSNVPYRIVSYSKILENPRSTITFDKELSTKLAAETKIKGSDVKLVQSKENLPYLVSLTSKMIQIVLTKASNFVPGGGIWLNTQRPEWNDANNALAGYGLSVVTLCYLNRYLKTLLQIFVDSPKTTFSLPKAQVVLMKELFSLYSQISPEKSNESDEVRKSFCDKAGFAFEKERCEFYQNGYNFGEENVSSEEILDFLKVVNNHVEYSIKLNKRKDGLFHSYNTLKISETKMEVEYLQEMLEGQVAVLSSGILSPEESKNLVISLQKSKIYEPYQNSFMLYPNKDLVAFQNKNNITEISGLEDFVAKTGDLYLQKDCNGTYHFNPDFRNALVMKDFISKQSEKNQPSNEESEKLYALYEKTFNHRSFTGRSGTFFAYEGLGSIYWHMVSKLLLAVQENVFAAYKQNNKNATKELTKLYYDVRNGLGFNKTPQLYGAFPADPYSHTPYHKGAKQPGMTGQVKEEILTRWGELGIFVEKGEILFNPIILRKNEIKSDGTLSFTWCGIPVKYIFNSNSENSISINEKTKFGTKIEKSEAKSLFERKKTIKEITVTFGNKRENFAD